MFSECRSLSSIDVDFTVWPAASNATIGWVYGVAATGTFTCPDVLPETFDTSHIPSGWTVNKKDYALKFESIDPAQPLSISFQKTMATAPTLSLKYSTNEGATWSTFTTLNTAQTLGGTSSLWLASNGNNTGTGLTSNWKSFNRIFTAAGCAPCKIKGHLMSLLGCEESQLIDKYAFNRLLSANTATTLVDASELVLPAPSKYGMFNAFFGSCTSLTAAPQLPAGDINEWAFGEMFTNCKSLLSVGEISASSVSANGCDSMFVNCSSLTAGPTSLPMTSLGSRCYYHMFQNCSSLTSAPDLPATQLQTSCYYEMFINCVGLSDAPAISATNMSNWCCRSMFQNCNSLTATPPQFSVLTAAPSCCLEMFLDCSSLTSAPITLSTHAGADGCYRNMMRRCTQLETPPNFVGDEIPPSAFWCAFYGCSNLTALPTILSATSLGQHCYCAMFRDCVSLEEVPVLPAMTIPNGAYKEMFCGCDGLMSVPSNMLTSPFAGTSAFHQMFMSCDNLSATPMLNISSPAAYAFEQMFEGCPNLVQANISGVTDAVNTNCMRYMFRNCTSLSSIRTNISSWNVAATNNWMANVPSEGWFYMNDTTVVPQRSASGVPEQWNVEPMSKWSNDSDGDGYSDAEEDETGSDPENSSSTPDDRDGDGYSNDDEEAAGTDPNDPDSHPEDEPEPDPEEEPEEEP